MIRGVVPIVHRQIVHLLIPIHHSCEKSTTSWCIAAPRGRAMRSLAKLWWLSTAVAASARRDIRRDGTVLGTRALELPGAHCRGHNKHSVGICYEGGLDAMGNPKDTRTPEQRSALRLLVHQLLKQFRNARVCGHRDLSPDLDGDGTVQPREWVKQCPCFEVSKEL